MVVVSVVSPLHVGLFRPIGTYLRAMVSAASSWALVSELTGHHGPVYGLAVGKDRSIWSAGGDGLLVRWLPAADGWSSAGMAVAKTDQALFCVHVLEDDEVLAGGASGGVLHWSSGVTTIVDGHEGGTLAMGNGWTSGADGRLLSWPGRALLGRAPGRIRCAVKSDWGWEMGLHDGRMWNGETGEGQALHEGSLRDVVRWPGKGAWGTVGTDGRMRIWTKSAQTESWSSVMSIDAHSGAIYRLCPSPCGQCLATASRDHTVALWSAESASLECRIQRPDWPGHTRSVNALCWMDRDTLVSAGDDRRILVWQRTG